MATAGTASSPNSIGYRAALAARTFWCAKCTCCPVPALGDLCCFCEDGVLCPRQKLKSKPVDAKQQQRVDVQVDKVRSDLERQIDELASALMNQGWKAARAKGVAAKVVADDPGATFDIRFRRVMSGNFGAELAPVKQRISTGSAGTLGTARNGMDRSPLAAPDAAAPRKEEVMRGTRTCSITGCTNRITATNKSGRCSEHWYVKKSDGASRNTAKRSAQPKANGHAAEPAAEGNSATATREESAPAVSGGQPPFRAPVLASAALLDRMWSALSLDEKVRLLEMV